ncbi:hypothetical protein [Rivihabitans pingtungensis]|uniref:hypothetical protein n=1 Tax=Rivihabitans pingtungensis TaxID=1054498 RepID=UPI00289DE80E|nr:hypothetical protein [Rivihabitans pingtungensis]
MIIRSALLAVCCVPLLAHAAAPADGVYVTERGWGVLSIKAGAFKLDAMGGNAHTCQVEGKLNAQGVAQPETPGNDERCELRLTREGAGVNVASTPGCRYFCGMRAGLDGLYLKPAAGCEPAQLRRQRALFKQQYDRKDYTGAVATLAPLLSQCQRTLDWLGEPWLRNDLALAQLRAGDAAACRATLAPLAADAARSDEAIRNDYPPSDADAYLSVLKATRTNLKLCR